MDMRLLVGLDNAMEQMRFFSEETFSPLSPKQMASYKNGSTCFYDSKDDVWALGITLLCFIYFEDFNVYYNWGKKEINLNKLNSHIEALKGKIIFNILLVYQNHF